MSNPIQKENNNKLMAIYERADAAIEERKRKMALNLNSAEEKIICCIVERLTNTPTATSLSMTVSDFKRIVGVINFQDLKERLANSGITIVPFSYIRTVQVYWTNPRENN